MRGLLNDHTQLKTIPFDEWQKNRDAYNCFGFMSSSRELIKSVEIAPSTPHLNVTTSGGRSFVAGLDGLPMKIFFGFDKEESAENYNDRLKTNSILAIVENV